VGLENRRARRASEGGLLLVGGFADVHGSFLGKQFGEHAVVLGIEMLDEDEGHAGVGSQVGEQI
jgi:hypothetical protein